MHTETRSPIVTTRQGRIQGLRENALDIFRGIPYARPPVGSLRFRNPQPLSPWEGIRNAVVSGPASFQMNLNNTHTVMEQVKRIAPGVPGVPAWPAYVGKTYHHENISEDCLYLDVWVPENAGRKKMPVYVYYHGGANAVSSGSFHLEDGANLARQENIIVVRPNYRLGALGWVHFGLISDAFPEAINLGLKDQFAALQWVHENIAAFGGDPDNVTIGGESCGATAVSHLLTYAPARKFFRRAIIQSLSPFNVWCTQNQAQAVRVAEKYLSLLDISSPEALADIDPERFLAMQNVLTRFFHPDKNIAWRPLGGVVDGEWIPEHPAEYLSSHAAADTVNELMIGFAKDEWQFFRGHTETLRHGSVQDVLDVLTPIYGSDGAQQLYEGYKELYPEHREPGHILSDIMSFEFFKFSSLKIARHFTRLGVPTWLFQFSYDLPGWNGELRAVHTGDMPFLWRNYDPERLSQWPAFDGIDIDELKHSAGAMGNYYAAFIRHGGEDLWPKFDEENQAILRFGKEVIPQKRLLEQEEKLFSAVGIDSVRQLEERLSQYLEQAFQE
ncbi:carboxylesterase [Kosakonia sp. H7A]|uniref:carboxylesterase/lipase family protein n=1 Tax=Kosakonia sp. H7A TaxID=2054598 RepID=UPI000D16F7A3|nr:carboxylesterase family protein [Kosakonia sp. H7A]PTA88438.1 carboxylesterase [Kosakonia sp. H7A]